MIDLNKRGAEGLKGHWLPGMLGVSPEQLGSEKRLGITTEGRRRRVKSKGKPPFKAAVPDLNDPATIGCLVHIVRERWKSPFATPRPRIQVFGSRAESSPLPVDLLPEGWLLIEEQEQFRTAVKWFLTVSFDGGGQTFEGQTEAEVLIKALEATPSSCGASLSNGSQS
jgi:hypothetical protein